MPLTKLDIIAALVVIDLQKGIVSLPTAHPASDIIARTAQLARAFREARSAGRFGQCTGTRSRPNRRRSP